MTETSWKPPPAPSPAAPGAALSYQAMACRPWRPTEIRLAAPTTGTRETVLMPAASVRRMLTSLLPVLMTRAMSWPGTVAR